jgi:hypothetical protein
VTRTRIPDRVTDPYRCQRCGTRAVTTYAWPTGRTATLCLACVSPLCERCGEAEATLSCGRRDGNWHLCAPCADAPEHRRKRRRPLVHRPRPATRVPEGNP